MALIGEPRRRRVRRRRAGAAPGCRRPATVGGTYASPRRPIASASASASRPFALLLRGLRFWPLARLSPLVVVQRYRRGVPLPLGPSPPPRPAGRAGRRRTIAIACRAGADLARRVRLRRPASRYSSPCGCGLAARAHRCTATYRSLALHGDEAREPAPPRTSTWWWFWPVDRRDPSSTRFTSSRTTARTGSRSTRRRSGRSWSSTSRRTSARRWRAHPRGGRAAARPGADGPMRIQSIKGRGHGAHPGAPTCRTGRAGARGVGRPAEYRSSIRDTPSATETTIGWSSGWTPGKWRQYARSRVAPVPVPMEVGAARELDVKVGDEMVWDVQGLAVRSRVAHLREVEWARFEPRLLRRSSPRGRSTRAGRATSRCPIEDPGAARALPARRGGRPSPTSTWSI